jgi:hypothetical protein
MSTNDAASKDSNGIADEQMTVPVPDGALVYRVERERRRTGVHIVAQELVDVKVDDRVDDPERLRRLLNELGHESAHVTHDGVER